MGKQRPEPGRLAPARGETSWPAEGSAVPPDGRPAAARGAATLRAALPQCGCAGPARAAGRSGAEAAGRRVTHGPDADADLNRVQLTGRLGSEPLLYDVGDHPVARLSLAAERRWRTPGGVLQVETTWFNLTAWEELAATCGRLLHAGDRVYVEGSLQLWTELRGPTSLVCHTIVLDRIVLLVVGRGSEAEAPAGGPGSLR